MTITKQFECAVTWPGNNAYQRKCVKYPTSGIYGKELLNFLYKNPNEEDIKNFIIQQPGFRQKVINDLTYCRVLNIQKQTENKQKFEELVEEFVKNIKKEKITCTACAENNQECKRNEEFNSIEYSFDARPLEEYVAQQPDVIKEFNQLIDHVEIPRNEDGSIDYAKIVDEQMYIIDKREMLDTQNLPMVDNAKPKDLLRTENFKRMKKFLTRDNAYYRNDDLQEGTKNEINENSSNNETIKQKIKSFFSGWVISSRQKANVPENEMPKPSVSYWRKIKNSCSNWFQTFKFW